MKQPSSDITGFAMLSYTDANGENVHETVPIRRGISDQFDAEISAGQEFWIASYLFPRKRRRRK